MDLNATDISSTCECSIKFMLITKNTVCQRNFDFCTHRVYFCPGCFIELFIELPPSLERSCYVNMENFSI